MNSLELNERELDLAKHIISVVNLLPGVTEEDRQVVMDAIEEIAYSAYMRGGEDK